MRYKVTVGGARHPEKHFATLDEAKRFTEDYFQRTGVFLGIEREGDNVKEELVTWVQYQDESGIWHDYQCTADPAEERKMIRSLNNQGNKTRSAKRKKSEEE